MTRNQSISHSEQIEALNRDFELWWIEVWPSIRPCDFTLNERTAKFIAWLSWIKCNDVLRKRMR